MKLLDPNCNRTAARTLQLEIEVTDRMPFFAEEIELSRGRLQMGLNCYIFTNKLQ